MSDLPPFVRSLLVPDLAARAQSLADIGLREAGWQRTDALAVLERLQGSAVAVLGGDVLRVEGNRPQHTYDNWHVEPVEGESFATYAARSQAGAAEYITRYPEKDGRYLYVLVAADGPDRRIT